MKLYRGIPHKMIDIKNAIPGKQALASYHRWWSARREIAAIWAGNSGTIVLGEGNVTPKGTAMVVDILDHNIKVMITGKEPV